MLIKLLMLYFFWRYRRVIASGNIVSLRRYLSWAWPLLPGVPMFVLYARARVRVCVCVCVGPSQIWRIPVEPLACTRVTRYMRSVTDSRVCTHRAYPECPCMWRDTIGQGRARGQILCFMWTVTLLRSSAVTWSFTASFHLNNLNNVHGC